MANCQSNQLVTKRSLALRGGCRRHLEMAADRPSHGPRKINSPDGEGRPECPADPPPGNCAQDPDAPADRVPDARDAWHIPRLGPEPASPAVERPDGAASGLR